MKQILKMRNLKVIFPTNFGIIRAVEGIDIDIFEGEVVALVGESGCGKTVTSQSLMKLIETPPAITKVDVLEFNGKNIKDYTPKQMQEIRGKEISMVFQDAMTSLNPVMTCGKQIDEMFIRHLGLSKKEAREYTIEALKLVGIPEPESRAKNFPHELSGGMRQRVLIAMAFACSPKLIIADEPTTALDVTIQAQIINLLKSMQKKHNMSILLVTHDLSVVANLADTVYVMYSGKIVEKSPMKDLFLNPYHPYSQGLLDSVPNLSDKKKTFTQIPGTIPNPINKPTGCYFHPRCPRATSKCKTQIPPLRTISKNREVRCFYPLNVDKKGEKA